METKICTKCGIEKENINFRIMKDKRLCVSYGGIVRKDKKAILIILGIFILIQLMFFTNYLYFILFTSLMVAISLIMIGGNKK